MLLLALTGALTVMMCFYWFHFSDFEHLCDYIYFALSVSFVRTKPLELLWSFLCLIYCSGAAVWTDCLIVMHWMQGETELGDNLPPPGLQDQSIIIIIIITIRMIIIIQHGNDDETIKFSENHWQFWWWSKT